MTTAWWLLIVFVAMDVGALVGWCLRVALTRTQGDGTITFGARERETPMKIDWEL